MDPRYSLQDVVRCHLCYTPVLPLHCVICNIALCEDCNGKHLSDKSIEHKVMPFKYWRSIPKCQKHFPKICIHYCEQCNHPICAQCVSSKDHQVHAMVDILESFKSKKLILQKDLQDLEENVFPKYKEIASKLSMEKADLNLNSKELTIAINNHFLNDKLEEYITRKTSEITHTIVNIRKLLDSNDVCRVLSYKSKNAEFKRVPPKLKVFLLSLTTHEMNGKQIYQPPGSLSVLSIEKTDHGNSIHYLSNKQFIDVPKIKSVINTRCGVRNNSLFNVSCMNEEYIWTCGLGNKLILYNMEGGLVSSIQTKSGNEPNDIAVTRNGDLVYTDCDDKTVNIVKITQIQTLFRLFGWRPLNVCCTSSGDLLVVMYSDHYKQTKVVCYSGSKEKQSIQYDGKGQPLYSFGNTKYITENSNLDICVSDFKARAVVVVNQSGKLRFTYTGPNSTTGRSFYPLGITTDSQGRILTSDSNYDCIHILDQDGQFIRFINNCHLFTPWGICVDTRDNLVVAENFTCKVKKIQYYIKEDLGITLI